MKRLYYLLLLLLIFAGCGKTETIPPVTKADFIDPLFYTYMQIHYDTNGDNVFQPEEIEQVKILDLSDQTYIYNLKGLEKFTALEELTIHYMNLEERNLKITNKHLRKLRAAVMGLTGLDVTALTELQYLDCSSNLFTGIDLSQNLMLEELYCNNSNLTSLDLSNHKKLKKVDGYNSRLLHSVNAYGCENLELLDLQSSTLDFVDVKNCNNLQYLYFNLSNEFPLLDISTNLSLRYLDIAILSEDGEKEVLIKMATGQHIPYFSVYGKYKIIYE